MSRTNWKKACRETQGFLDDCDSQFWQERARAEHAEAEMAKASGRCLDLELRLTAILGECQADGHWGGVVDCPQCRIWRLARHGKP